jgi:putative toxin-antitoxin system antitoxin component (TIGR02293 family)
MTCATENTTIEALELLGLSDLADQVADCPLALHQSVSRGLPASAVRHLLMACPDLSLDTIAKVTGISPGAHRTRAGTKNCLLKADQSSQLLLLAKTLVKAFSAFGDWRASVVWLNAPVTGLDGQVPADLITTPYGYQVVDEYLDRISHGIYT